MGGGVEYAFVGLETFRVKRYIAYGVRFAKHFWDSLSKEMAQYLCLTKINLPYPWFGTPAWRTSITGTE